MTPRPIVITIIFAGHQASGLAGAVVATAGVFLLLLRKVTWPGSCAAAASCPPCWAEPPGPACPVPA